MRDLLLGRASPDADLLIPYDALETATALAGCLNIKCIIMNRDILPTARLMLAGGAQIDITQWRGLNLGQDLSLRDFTCNALALPLPALLQGSWIDSAQIIDPRHGLDDIKNKLIRLASASALKQDPLRIIRAYRLKAELGFSFEQALEPAIKEALPGLSKIAQERLGQEWLRLMGQKKAAGAITDMDPLLSFLVPGWEACRGLKQNPYHHLPVLEHSLDSVRALEEILNQPHLRDLHEDLADIDLPLLKTATLLHDLGKAPTARFKAPGWNSFYNHDKAGARLAEKACLNLGLGRRQAEFVSRLVARHMLPQHLLNAVMRYPFVRNRQIRRFILRNQNIPQLMLMALADIMAGKGPKRPPELEKHFIALWREMEQVRKTQPPPAPLLNGHQVMAACDLKESPLLGRILKRLRNCQLDGKVDNEAQALDLVRQWAEEEKR